MNEVRTGSRVLAFSLALLVSTVALAGLKVGHGVRIDDPDRFADGDLGSVRSTDDPNQAIGCYSFGNFGSCVAQDQNATVRTCMTSDAAMLATIRSLNGDSYLMFEWDANGYCTLLEVYNWSAAAPKT